MFTANEMVTAIANHPANMDMTNRFERAGFAEFLSEQYGSDDETAAETLAWLYEGKVFYEGTDISYLYRDLLEYREEQAPRGLGGWEG